MTGRGIDQALPHPVDPVIYEPYITDARDYINLAQKANGIFNLPLSPLYIWGDALEQFEHEKPDFRIINLETSITKNNDYWKGKGINYRMSPANITCITSAAIDCCALANNHVLDWGYQGLKDTLDTLKKYNIQCSGAGINKKEAKKPAILTKNKMRVLVFSVATESSGVPLQWEADSCRPGVNLLQDLTEDHAHSVGKWIEMFRRSDDLVVLSIHWGANWVFKIPSLHIQFAHTLIDNGYVDLIHGHSSHHILEMEVYKGKPIIYGCGDFINDYEGIGGQEVFRGDISMMFFIAFDTPGRKLQSVTLVPLIKHQFSLKKLSVKDLEFIEAKLNLMGGQFETRVISKNKTAFSLQWDKTKK